MRQVTIEEAGPQLAELVRQAQGGEEVILTQDNAPVVRLSLVTPNQPSARQLGTAAGLVYMADDFDVLDEGWEEYV